MCALPLEKQSCDGRGVRPRPSTSFSTGLEVRLAEFRGEVPATTEGYRPVVVAPLVGGGRTKSSVSNSRCGPVGQDDSETDPVASGAIRVALASAAAARRGTRPAGPVRPVFQVLPGRGGPAPGLLVPSRVPVPFFMLFPVESSCSSSPFVDCLVAW